MPSHRTMQAIVLDTFGGPQVLRLCETPRPAPGAGEVLVRHTAIGVNFHDCYVRSGLYRTLPLPGIPGIEATGVVEALGSGVAGLAVGQRVGWVSGRYGGYATHRVMPAAEAIRLPDSLDDADLAATLMKALTVSVLVSRAHVVQPGQTVLVHAAAGGVGQLLCNWCRHLGATVIGTVGTRAKAAVAEAAGAHHIILYREEDFVARVQQITGGAGVAAVYDAVGKDTFAGSLASLAFEGTLVNYGQASGPVAALTPADLAVRSLTLVRPIVFHYLRDADRLADLSSRVFDAFAAGVIRPIAPLRLPLAEAAAAHEVLESQRSPGGVVLLP
ncbi:NADPH2:quinone reductase [Gemmobacter megaterium]|uniref:NADPH2:quinone reductase n=1 Tax=Gemmobacter megaterium TaxID=1086013 RepID=A0A1N7KSK4_9RHOB|nr:quinone oxidoreductase [Gemmobacter megaterium]GGE03616.1 quinone oxidoreductase [Gemmobacter megaterium]SIS64602.1 NADPH2:quinone reductase [Gemmobacter megaterium]